MKSSGPHRLINEQWQQFDIVFFWSWLRRHWETTTSNEKTQNAKKENVLKQCNGMVWYLNNPTSRMVHSFIGLNMLTKYNHLAVNLVWPALWTGCVLNGRGLHIHHVFFSLTKFSFVMACLYYMQNTATRLLSFSKGSVRMILSRRGLPKFRGVPVEGVQLQNQFPTWETWEEN